MAQANQNKSSYYFLVDNDRVIGTPENIASSERTIDMPFYELAENYDLQVKLRLLSHIRMETSFTSSPLEGSKLHNAVAFYLSSFSNNPFEREKRREYLDNNGLVRILVTDEALFKEVKRVI